MNERRHYSHLTIHFCQDILGVLYQNFNKINFEYKTNFDLNSGPPIIFFVFT